MATWSTASQARRHISAMRVRWRDGTSPCHAPKRPPALRASLRSGNVFSDNSQQRLCRHRNRNLWHRGRIAFIPTCLAEQRTRPKGKKEPRQDPAGAANGSLEKNMKTAREMAAGAPLVDPQFGGDQRRSGTSRSLSRPPGCGSQLGELEAILRVNREQVEHYRPTCCRCRCPPRRS